MRCHSLQDELDKMEINILQLMQDVDCKLVTENKLRKESKLMRTKIMELERSVRNHQLDNYEALAELERLRNHVMRIVFAVISENQFTSNKSVDGSDTSLPAKSESTENKDCQMSSSKQTTSITEPDSSQNLSQNEELIDRVKFLANDYKRLQHELRENCTAEEKIKQRNKELENELDQFIRVYAEAQQKMKDTPGLRSSVRLKQQIELLTAYVPTSEILKRFRRILLDDLEDQMNIQQRLEDSTQEAVGIIQSQDTDINLLNRSDDLISTIKHLAELTSTMIQQKTELLKQLKTNELVGGHEGEIGKINQNKADVHMDSKKTKGIKSRDKKAKSFEEVEQKGDRKRHQDQTIIEELENELRETRQILAEKQKAHETELSEAKEANKLLSKLQHEIELKEHQIEQLKLQLGNQQKSLTTSITTPPPTTTTCIPNITTPTSLLLSSLHDDGDDSEQRPCESSNLKKSDTQTTTNKEQVRQQSRTICIIQDRLIKMKKELNETKNEVTRLRRTNTDLQNEYKQLQITSKPASAHSYGDESTSPKLIDKLKLKISRLKNVIKDQTSTIEVLRSGLEGTQFYSCDSKGELSEIQKEIEDALNCGKKTNLELFNTRTQLINMKNSFKQMNKKLNEKEDEIKKLKSRIKELKNNPKEEIECKVKNVQENGQIMDVNNSIDALRVSFVMFFIG
ncbi:unnamed protein product [Schistosoma turkestanicum]|nr:unnamed protein product [Schistosoma turkestanicum]